MSAGLAAALQVLMLVAALVVVHRPFGDYMAVVYEGRGHLRVERVVYRLTGVEPDGEQRWPVYVRSVLAFSVVSIVALYGLLRLNRLLPYSLGYHGMPADGAFNTAVSFVTNTNWQWYSGESTLGYGTQALGLAVQNFVSASVGMAVAVALIRGFARSRTDRLGNFWVDLVRGCVRILLPISFVAAVVLVAGGAVQNLIEPHTVDTIAGQTQTIPGGLVGSQEAIKDLGTNGGGYFNANSSHPFENPTAWTNLLEIFLLLVIPFSLPRTFGRMVRDTRQGYAIAGVMGLIWAAAVTATTVFESQHGGAALRLAGAAMEGKEVRFGVPASALFATSTTLTSTGSVDSFHDSFTPLGGGVTIVDMLLGEVAPGGVGSGLYGMLVLAVLAVFLAGLMVGRTPEYLGKKIRAREVKLVALYVLTTPALVLVGTGVASVYRPMLATRLNGGPHGLSEMLYAFSSAANNNGSAFAGLGVDTVPWNTALGLAMLFGRLLPIVFVLALAGSLAGQRPVPVSAGTLPTHRPLFAGLLTFVVVIVAALTFLPVLALGPLAEGLA